MFAAFHPAVRVRDILQRTATLNVVGRHRHEGAFRNEGAVGLWAFGKELDSLADLVSFGVAPAFLAYQSQVGPSQMVGRSLASLALGRRDEPLER